MKLLIVFILFAVVLATAVAQSHGDQATPKEKKEFKQWMKKYNKRYHNRVAEEDAIMNWLEHKRNIEAHNKQHRRGQNSHEMELFDHADMSLEEIKYHKTGVIHPDDEDMRKKMTRVDNSEFPTGPKYVDWRRQNLVGPVQYQQCRDCWTYASTGVIEGLLRRKNITTKLSEQNLIDCADTGYNFGCRGGFPYNAIKWVEENGITSQKNYPYLNGTDGDCAYNGTNEVTRVKKVVQVDTAGNETLLRDIVAKVGPVSILICVDSGFQAYNGGVYQQEDCCMGTDHAVLLVGYGRDPRWGDYWLIRNSWGTDFGVNGYIKFARNYGGENGNMCNVAQQAVVSIQS